MTMSYTFTLNEHDIRLISQALVKRPFEEVAGLIKKLDTQLDAQKVKPEAKETENPAEQSVEPVAETVA